MLSEMASINGLSCFTKRELSNSCPPPRHNSFPISPICVKFNSCYKIPVQPTILLKSKNPSSRFYKAVELNRFITSEDEYEEDEMSETFFKAIEELASMTREPSDVLEEMNSRLSARELQLVLVYFSQDGRDSWCALEVFEWLKKENRVDKETMELMVSIMCGWVKKMIESKGNVGEVANLLVDMDCVGLKPSFSMIEKVICLYWDLGEKEKAVLFVKEVLRRGIGYDYEDGRERGKTSGEHRKTGGPIGYLAWKMMVRLQFSILRVSWGQYSKQQ